MADQPVCQDQDKEKCSTPVNKEQTGCDVVTDEHFPRFILIWLDCDLNTWNDHHDNLVEELRSSVRSLQKIDNTDECVDYITSVKQGNILLVMEFNLGQRILSLFHDIRQLHSVFLFRKSPSDDETMSKRWLKLKGTFLDLISLCRAVQQTVRNATNHLTEISIFSPHEEIWTRDLTAVDRSFMYTLLLKEIIFDMHQTEESMEQMIGYCQDLHDADDILLDHIERFHREYHQKPPSWWYTRESFLYNTLNLSLRTQDIDAMVLLGPFIRDLHHDIEHLHAEQSKHQFLQPFPVYRGQALSMALLNHIRKNFDGLLSFNNFLSTSRDRSVSLAFAESNALDSTAVDSIGVLFEMFIDPSISSSPFASLADVGYYQNSEEEILFSMHTVFRIGQVRCIEPATERVWQVNLTLIDSNAQNFKVLTDQMRLEIEGTTEIHRLGQLMFKLGEYKKAEQVYNTLLSLSIDESSVPFYYNQLASIQTVKGNYQEAIAFHEKALKLYEADPNAKSTSLVNTYNNIATAYGNFGNYSEAMSFYEKALAIAQDSQSESHASLAMIYTNMATMSKNMGDYSKALSLFEKVLDIEQQSICNEHPSVAATYRRIGLLHRAMNNYEMALSYCQRAIDIHEKVLPPHHPELGTSYMMISKIFQDKGEHSTALPFLTKTRLIYQKTLPTDHPDVASLHDAMGSLQYDLKDYSNALTSYETALNIWKKTLSADHPNLATSFNNIALVYRQQGEYSKAKEYFEKSLSITKKIFPENDRRFAEHYNNIGLLYAGTGEHNLALSAYQEVLRILSIEPEHHRQQIIACHNHITSAQYALGNYAQALASSESSLSLAQQILPANHSMIETLLENIGVLKKKLKTIEN